ncbi:relaxase/mobilization nuclease domain-containing protein [Flavobacterium ginsenosidimutans]|uniref:relaxase/mobilization nuclease domain-containing protein n=1 Tax=Flavobacterium ginsenosidimutans TaxID=687844 RepID=UPI000DAE5ABD|nr:relaxase/mobilization nuclease domain-containing protein [Flavobacterium ginsenosidimutans]KAF2328043.1 relaxase/mobilization nuclease domain-containing protein [Flavobacterium ginsenosidimutans]
MVAVIKTGHSLHRIFSYNENKVQDGQAKCIGEGNYPAAAEDLSRAMKLNRLLHQAALNGNVKRSSVHISLNFHPSENHSKEKLMEIADIYMEKIGFGQQPYLVYEHFDAGHPHIHLVSVKIKEDGSRIDMQNIGRNQSEKARKEIEKSFNLVRAEGQERAAVLSLKPVPAGRAAYGKMESKKAISSVLQQVLYNYRYASLAELNAVLQLYNIKADRGSEDSRVFKSGGLVYRILDKEGKPAGVPIKASDFAIKPTLAFLEKRFALNASENAFEKKRIRNAVDTAFLQKDMDFEKLFPMLGKEGIHAVLRRSNAGKLYGITYVDHVTKCVLNGSALGKSYSAKGMLERCGGCVKMEGGAAHKTSLKNVKAEPQEMSFKNLCASAAEPIAAQELQRLLKPEWQPDYAPAAFKRKRGKRKGKRRSNLN